MLSAAATTRPEHFAGTFHASFGKMPVILADQYCILALQPVAKGRLATYGKMRSLCRPLPPRSLCLADNRFLGHTRAATSSYMAETRARDVCNAESVEMTGAPT